MHVQSKNLLTQAISSLRDILKTTDTQTYNLITSCIEQLVKLQTKINNIEQGNSGFVGDNNINQLQSVTTFLINCSTDIVNYHNRYVSTTSDTNRYKNTIQKKGFWTKAIEVIAKAKSQADNQNNKRDEWRKITQQNEQLKKRLQQAEGKLNQQQIRVLKQSSLEIIAGNFKNINNQWFIQNANSYYKISDFYNKYKLPTDVFQTFIIEFSKIKKLAEHSSNKQNITLLDKVCVQIIDLQKEAIEAKKYKSLLESVKADLPDSQAKIIKGCFAEQNYRMYENKISYKDTCSILKVVIDDYQSIAQLLSRLAIICGGEEPFYKSSNYTMSMRCNKMVDKIERDLKNGAQYMQSQTSMIPVTNSECSTSAMLTMIKSYRNFMDIKLSNNKMQVHNQTPINNPRIQHNSRVDNQGIMSEQQKQALIISKHFEQILADTKTTIVSQIQPYGDKNWTWWRSLFDPNQSTRKQQSVLYLPVDNVNADGQYRKQSTELPQIIIVQVLTQLANAYDLPKQTSVCQLLDQIAKQELMVEWIKNHYKRQPDSQYQSTKRTQSIPSLQKKISSGQLSFTGSGIYPQQYDPNIYKAKIKTVTSDYDNKNNTYNNNIDHQNGAHSWSQNIKLLQANNTKYLDQLSILRNQNRKQKQTIAHYQTNVNFKISKQQQLLSKIKQLETNIGKKEEQITNLNNIMVQNVKKKQDEIKKYKNNLQNMQIKVKQILTLIYIQQNITNQQYSIDTLITAVTFLIKRKQYYKTETYRLQSNNKLKQTDEANNMEKLQKTKQQFTQFIKKVSDNIEIIVKKRLNDKTTTDQSKLCEQQQKEKVLTLLNECLTQLSQLKIQDTTNIFNSKQNEEIILTELKKYCQYNGNHINKFNLLFRGSQGGCIDSALKKHANILLVAKIRTHDQVHNFACYSSLSNCHTRDMPKTCGLLISTNMKQSYPLIQYNRPAYQQNSKFVVFGNNMIKISKQNPLKIVIDVTGNTGFDIKNESAFNLFGTNANQIIVDQLQIYEVVFKEDKIVNKGEQHQMANDKHQSVLDNQKKNDEIKKLQQKIQQINQQSKSKDQKFEQIRIQKIKIEQIKLLLTNDIQSIKQEIEKYKIQTDRIKQQKQDLQSKFDEIIKQLQKKKQTQLQAQYKQPQNSNSTGPKLDNNSANNNLIKECITNGRNKKENKSNLTFCKLTQISIKAQIIKQQDPPFDEGKKNQSIIPKTEVQGQDVNSQINKTVQEIEVQYHNKRKQMQEMKQFILKAKENSNKLKKKDSQCEKLIQKKQQQLSKLNQQIAQKTLRIIELRVQLTTMQDKTNEITNLREQINQLKKQLQNRPKTQTAQSIRKQQVQDKQKDKDKKQQKQSDQKQLEAVRLALKDLNQKLSLKQKQYNAKLSSLAQLGKREKTTGQKVKDMEKKLSDMTKQKEQVDLIMKDMDSTKQIKQDLQKQIESLKIKKQKLDTQYKSLVADLQPQMKKHNILKVQLNSITNKVEGLKSQKDKLSQKIKSQETQIGDLTKQIGDLTQQLEEINKNKDVLAKQLAIQKQKHQFFMSHSSQQKQKLNTEIIKASKELNETKSKQLKISGIVSKFFIGEVIEDEIDCKFIIDEISKLYPYRTIKRTKLLFAFPLMKDVNPHITVDGVPFYILIVKMHNRNDKGKNYVIAMHSEKELVKDGQLNNGKGFISSVSNQKTFYLRNTPMHNPRVTMYEDFYIKFGNDEMYFKLNSPILETCIGNNYKSFDTKNLKDPEVFTGSHDSTAEMEAYEFWQIVWNQQ